LTRVQGDATETEAFHVAGNRPHRDAEVVRQVREPYPLAAGRVQSFDEHLLAFDTPQCQVPVAGGCGEPDGVPHCGILKATPACLV
jgi:hypothetical protein